MSNLSIQDKAKLEQLLNMGGGYVMDFSNNTFANFVADIVEVDIYAEQYRTNGDSKANRLRAFWKNEPDAQVANLLEALLEYHADRIDPENKDASLRENCSQIVSRLRSSGSNLKPLKEQVETMTAPYLARMIERMEKNIDGDPELSIGTAKELIETCCKTILAERGSAEPNNQDVSALTKATLKALDLVPSDVPDQKRGSDTIKRLLNNLGVIGIGLAELRNLYGTGHGRHGAATGLKPRHAKLAVGAAATLVTFLFETHQETTRK